MAISDLIRDIPNFPKDGIIFRDVTTLFGDPQGLSLVTAAFKELWLGSQIDYIAGIDARGFIVGGALAYELKAGLSLRKKGKLPFNTISEKYSLEYGEAEMEVHVDSCGSGDSSRNRRSHCDWWYSYRWCQSATEIGGKCGRLQLHSGLA